MKTKKEFMIFNWSDNGIIEWSKIATYDTEKTVINHSWAQQCVKLEKRNVTT